MSLPLSKSTLEQQAVIKTFPTPATAQRRRERIPLQTLLNLTLANSIDLKSRCALARWQAGKSGTLHLFRLYEDFNDELDLTADMLGQRILAIGGQPKALPADVVRLSRLPQYPTLMRWDVQHAECMCESIDVTAEYLNAAMDGAEQHGDRATLDVLQRLQRRLKAKRRALTEHLETQPVA